MTKVTTDLGEVFIDDKSDDELFIILDSDKNWISNLYKSDYCTLATTITSLLGIHEPADIAEAVAEDGIAWGDSQFDLAEVMTDLWYGASEVEGDQNETLEIVKEYTNRIGNTYFIINPTEI